MKFFNKNKLLFRILFVAFAVLFTFVATGNVIATENKKAINKFLKITDYDIVDIGGEAVDTDYFKSDYENLASLMDDGQKLAEEVEEEGAVLLKNENSALPLAKNDKVALFGYASVDPAYGGSGSAASDNPKPEVNMLDGFKNAGLDVNEVLYNFYKTNKNKYAPSGYDTKDAPWTDITANSGVMSSFSTKHAAAIFVVKRCRGENDDPSYEYLQLSDNERSVLKGLKSLKGVNFDKIIVLFNTPNQVETDFLADEEYGVDAALWIGAVGQTGLNAVGKILVGDVNPSGRLSDTYWTKHEYNPALSNFGVNRYANAKDFSSLPSESNSSYTKMTSTAFVAYTEGIYVGYRYTETRYEDIVTKRANAGTFDYNEAVSYPFGYGLSYTTFEYSDFKVSYNAAKDEFEVNVTVTNTGAEPGKEVCQIYLAKPYTQYDIENQIEKSAVELVGFAKTGVIAAGGREEVKVTVDGKSLASYDATSAKTYVTSTEDYYLTIGKNAHSAVNNVLSEKGYGVKDGMTEEGEKTLVKSVTAAKKKYDKAATGNEITNLFDSSDWNKYENNGGTTLVYVSRSDWQGTLPNGIGDKATLFMTQDMVDEILSFMNSDSIEPDNKENPTLGADQIRSLVELRTDADGNPLDYEFEEWDTLVDQLDWAELTALLTTGMRKTEAAPSVTKPETVEHNGPTGVTERYDFGANGLATKYGDPDKEYSPTYYPCLGILAASFNADLAERVGNMYGEDALWAGYSGLYGIGLNIHRTAYDGRAFEYYSEDGYLSGKMAAKLVAALQKKGCNGYVKHLVGYEQQANRVGLAVWATEQTLREIYLKPFEIAVTEGGAMNCMAAYTRLGTKFCAGHKELLTDFLRGECGMKGFVVSDMYKDRYKNEQLPLFLMAGCDLPDGDIASANIYEKYSKNYSAVVTRMKDAAKRILYATAQSNAMNGLSPSNKIVPKKVAWQVALDTSEIVLGVLLALSVVGFALSNLNFGKIKSDNKEINAENA